MAIEIVNLEHNRWQAVSEGIGLALLRWSGEHMVAYWADGTELGTLYRSNGRLTITCAGCGARIGSAGDGSSRYVGPDGLSACSASPGLHVPGERSIAYTWRAYLAGPGGREVARGAPQADAVAAILAGSGEAKTRRAYKLGSDEAYMGRPLRDMSDADSAWLMTELGETGPTAAHNWPERMQLCDAYTDGWHDAKSALAV